MEMTLLNGFLVVISVPLFMGAFVFLVLILNAITDRVWTSRFEKTWHNIKL
jgi:hypothetical protein